MRADDGLQTVDVACCASIDDEFQINIIVVNGIDVDKAAAVATVRCAQAIDGGERERVRPRHVAAARTCADRRGQCRRTFYTLRCHDFGISFFFFFFGLHCLFNRLTLIFCRISLLLLLL